MSNKSKFSEIFFPDSVLYNKFDNLEKVRSITNVYDEITVPPGAITSNLLYLKVFLYYKYDSQLNLGVEPIDNDRFMVIRDFELMEIWNID